jgi:hypothetical protein
MKPTNNLRFTERDVVVATSGDIGAIKKLRILQQWWASDPDNLMDWTLKQNGEWRDVPVEELK